MLKRLSPAAMWTCALAVWLAALVMVAGARSGWWQASVNEVRLAFSLPNAASYAAGMILCWHIAGEHRESPRMRRAWLLLAASGGFSVLRHLTLGLVSLRTPDGPDSLAGYLATQSLMILALASLTAGLFCIWRTFSLLELGFRPHTADLVLLVSIVLFAPPILASRSFAQPSDYHPLVAGLRYGGAILLAVSAAMAVQLHRVALQMQGGAMAKALQILVIFTGGRLLMMLLSAVPAFRANEVISGLTQATTQALPLLFAVAAAYRWRITEQARTAVAEYEEETAEEVAG